MLGCHPLDAVNCTLASQRNSPPTASCLAPWLPARCLPAACRPPPHPLPPSSRSCSLSQGQWCSCTATLACRSPRQRRCCARRTTRRLRRSRASTESWCGRGERDAGYVYVKERDAFALVTGHAVSLVMRMQLYGISGSRQASPCAALLGRVEGRAGVQAQAHSHREHKSKSAGPAIILAACLCSATMCQPQSR